MNKKVIYLDQNVISEIYKISAGVRKKASNEDFWAEVTQKVRTAVLLHQAIFPISDLHKHETTVFYDPDSLRIAHEMLGDVDFMPSNDVTYLQELECLRAFLSSGTQFSFHAEVDDILQDARNVWLADLHISAEFGEWPLAHMQRSDRAHADQLMNDIWKKWMQEKPTYRQAQQRELELIGSTYLERLGSSGENRLRAHFADLSELFVEKGLSEPAAKKQVIAFWNDISKMQLLPAHRIFARLFAALARQAANGRTNVPTASILTDISAIAGYSPYVDAMFVDKECAHLINETSSDGPLNAKIFSVRNKDEFLSYLDDLIADTPDDVRTWSNTLYS